MFSLSGNLAGNQSGAFLRPATAIVIVILLVIIAVAGIIQLFAIFQA